MTLVLQGLSLPALIRGLKVKADESLEHEEWEARERATLAALARLDEIGNEDWSIPEQVEQMRMQYDHRLKRYAQREATGAESTQEAAHAFRRLRHELLTAERLAAIRMRNDGAISDEVLQNLEHELDAEALRYGIGELRVPSRNRSAKAERHGPARRSRSNCIRAGDRGLKRMILSSRSLRNDNSRSLTARPSAVLTVIRQLARFSLSHRGVNILVDCNR